MCGKCSSLVGPVRTAENAAIPDIGARRFLSSSNDVIGFEAYIRNYLIISSFFAAGLTNVLVVDCGCPGLLSLGG